MEKPEILMYKSVCLGLSMLELSKILTCEFWFDYIKLKYGEKAKLCLKSSFTVYIYNRRC